LSTVVDFDAWKSLYTNGSSVLTELSLGAQYTVFQSGGATSAPSWGLITNDNVAASGTANIAWNKLNASASHYAGMATDASGYPVAVPGETSNTRKFLRSVGVAGAATAPAWDTLTSTDLPAHEHAWGDITSGVPTEFPPEAHEHAGEDITSGTVGTAYGGTGTGALTVGSVVFAGVGGVYSQDNANLFWDNTNKRLGVGNAAPAYPLDVTGAIRCTGTATIGAYTLPATDGTLGQVPTTDGAGAVSWATPTASVTAPLTLTVADAATNSVTDILTVEHTTSGTAAAGFGAGVPFKLENSAGASVVAGRIVGVWSDATSTTEIGRISIRPALAGSAASILEIAEDISSEIGGSVEHGIIVRTNGSTCGIVFWTDDHWCEIAAPYDDGRLHVGGGGYVETATFDTNNGRVGVMNDSPAYPLDVTGEIHTSTKIHTPKAMMDDGGGLRVKLTNKTGAASVLGKIVAVSTTTDNAVKLVATDDLYGMCGVMAESGVADGAEMWVWVGGRVQVKMEAAAGCTRGQMLSVSDSTAATGSADDNLPKIGTALASAAANALVYVMWAVVDY
jgi:hypothetical protein